MPLIELTDPAAVFKAMEEFDRLGRSRFLATRGFLRSREYMLRRASGKLYDAAAIASLALQLQHREHGGGGVLQALFDEKSALNALERLGFEVIRVGENWTREEVQLCVADYFHMLALEACGTPYNKSEHNEQLRALLPARSKSSIELKHQNISAVLDALDLPYIRGYKPRANFQGLLAEVVRATIDARHAALVKVMDDLEAVREPGASRYYGVLVDPPRAHPVMQLTRRRLRLPRKFDYAGRDEHNRALGRAGEHWTVEFERTRLGDLQRGDLADNIDWIADRLGDGTGYDIRSFEEDARERFIEVKTTNGSALAPFVVSRNELEFSQEAGDAFFLYRLFDYTSSPRLFMLRGDLSSQLNLTPMDYRARLKAL